jgi:hypothetical protein
MICIGYSGLIDNFDANDFMSIRLDHLTLFQTTSNENMKFVNFLEVTPNLTRIHLENEIDYPEEEADEIATFLACQPKLCELYLSADNVGIFRIAEFCQHHFTQLKSLVIDGKHFKDVEWENFRVFLKQQDALRLVSLGHMQVKFESMKLIFNEMRMLQEVIFSGSVFQICDGAEKLEDNGMIERLSISFCKCPHFGENTSGLLKILLNLRSIRFLNFTRESMTGVLETLKASAKLEMLELYKSQIPPAALPQVQKAEFVYCDQCEVQKFLEANKCLKKYSCEF